VPYRSGNTRLTSQISCRLNWEYLELVTNPSERKYSQERVAQV
jgi:hypothetical protein